MPALILDSDYSLFNSDSIPPPSPSLSDSIALALQNYPSFKFLPCNDDPVESHVRNPGSPSSVAFSCDDFRMYEFKVRRCMRGRSHDWTECPFAHPGEKARRRDPRRIHYSGTPCPDFRKGSCRRGDACEFAHGVFECWLHPARYRTQACKDGKNCKRRVCFFAHSQEQLRVLPTSTAMAPTSTAEGTTMPASISPQKKLSLEGSYLPQKLYSDEQSNLICTSPRSLNVGLQQAYMFGSAGHANCSVGIPSQTVSMSAIAPGYPTPTNQVRPMNMHLDSVHESPLRRAMAQNFMACKGYGGASFNMNSVAQCLSGSMGTSPLASLFDDDFEEARFFQLASLDNKSKYELAGGQSYGFPFGFASPTSTLAGHLRSPPPLSPPLSPLTSPSSINSHYTNSVHNFSDETPYGSMSESGYIHATKCVEDIGLRLQELLIPHSCNRPELSQLQNQQSRHEILECNMLQSPPQLRIPPPPRGHCSYSLPCADKFKWSPPCEFSDCKGSASDVGSEEDEFSHEMMSTKTRGSEESVVDLDVGWVSELVK